MLSKRIRKRYHTALGTSVIKSPNVPSLPEFSQICFILPVLKAPKICWIKETHIMSMGITIIKWSPYTPFPLPTSQILTRNTRKV